MAEETELVVTRPCPDCGEAITGKAQGAGSINWKMGAHRARAHGYRNPDAPKRARRRPRDDTQPVVVGIVQDVLEDLPSSGGKKPPTADELSRALGKGLGIASITVASYAVETDANIPDGPAGEAERQNLVAYLSLKPRDAQDVMKPFAKAIAGTGVNVRYGRAIVENVDVVSGLGEVVKLALHWRRYFRERNRLQAAKQPIEARSWPGPTAPPATGAIDLTPGGPRPVGNIGVVDVGVGPQTPPPTEGVVLTPEMLRTMGVENDATRGPNGAVPQGVPAS